MMKRSIVWTALALAGLLFAAACEQPAGTGATVAETLRSAAALANIGVDPDYPLDGEYSLGADLILEDWTPIGTSAAPFAGTFDGKGRTITITGSGGLFGFTEGALIRDVTIEGTISASSSRTVFVGGIAGNATETTITHCISNADIAVVGQDHNSSAGGIAGFLSNNSRIADCRATGDISLKSDANKGLMLYGGGIAGYQGLKASYGSGVSGCVIERCSFTGSVVVEGGYPYAGGILGYNYVGAKLRESYAVGGSVTAKGENLPYAGGVSGYNSRGDPDNPSLIENCYSNIGVHAEATSQTAQAGGVTAANAAGAAISKCYARGAVAATVVGSGGDDIGGSLGVKIAANAGGIAGAQYFGAPTLKNCAALNTSVTGAGSDSYNVYRIAGPGHPDAEQSAWASNIASAPLYKGEQLVAPDSAGPNGYDGADCAATPGQSAYEALGWDFDSVWAMDSEGYPVLQWQAP
jgi:hypothetical protein